MTCNHEKKRDLLLRETSCQACEDRARIENLMPLTSRPMFSCTICAVELPEMNEDDEKMASDEFSQNFPGEPLENKRVICDECYQVMIKVVKARRLGR